MTNPAGTKEQREELRREALEEIAMGAVGLCHDMPAALDGLDIAEKAMRARLVEAYLFTHNWDTNFLPNAWSQWIVAAQHAEDEALAEWDKWKGS